MSVERIIHRVYDDISGALRTTSGGSSVLIREIEYDANNNPIYLGLAEPGTATNDAGWLIYKFFYDANGNCTSVRVAEGESELNKVWDDRASYAYL